MGSASREALLQARQALPAVVHPQLGAELFAVAAQCETTPALAAAFTDATATLEHKEALLARVSNGVSAVTRDVLLAAIRQRWSAAADFVAGVEELGLRAVATLHAEIADELLAVADVIDRNHELQLTLGSKLTSASDKTVLVRRLFADRVSEPTFTVLSQFVAFPRGRRLDSALRAAATLAADQGGQQLVTVTLAAQLSAAQFERLARILERTAGRPVKITTVIDPELVGGMRVQIADDVIDGSVRTRLDDLRQQLAA